MQNMNQKRWIWGIC